MVNTNMEFKHPKYYKELEKIRRSLVKDQATSSKPQASSSKPQASSNKLLEVQVIHQDLSNLKLKK